MLPLIWNPAWDYAGLSLWAIAQRMAFAGYLFPSDVLFELAGASTARRMDIWTGPPNKESHGTHLPLIEESPRFLEPFEPFDGLPRLLLRQRYSVGLRWCPLCLHDWYHTAHFQNVQVAHCPWHDCPLEDHCRRCGRLVDPFAQDRNGKERPERDLRHYIWRCSACAHPLVRTPDDWLNEFKTHPAHDGSWPAELPQSQQAFVELDNGARRVDPAQHRASVRHAQTNHSGWLATHLYEEGSVLMDALLWEHVKCLPFENAREEQGFGCPVAAAVNAVYSALHCDARPEGWPFWRVRQAEVPDSYFYGLEPWHQRMTARDVFRFYLFHMLMVHADVANVGRYDAGSYIHMPAFDAKQLLTVGSKGEVTFPGLVTAADLVRAAKRAGRLCRNNPQGDIGRVGRPRRL